jgi:hypothetical protein
MEEQQWPMAGKHMELQLLPQPRPLLDLQEFDRLQSHFDNDGIDWRSRRAKPMSHPDLLPGVAQQLALLRVLCRQFQRFLHDVGQRSGPELLKEHLRRPQSMGQPSNLAEAPVGFVQRFRRPLMKWMGQLRWFCDHNLMSYPSGSRLPCAVQQPY